MPDYGSRYSDDPAIQKLLDRLIEAGDEMPDKLRDDLLAAGDEATSALIALLEDEEMALETSPGDGWGPIHAARLLGKRGDAEAIEPLIEVVAEAELDEYLYSSAIFALRAIGKPAIEPILAAIEEGGDDETRDGLAEVLADVAEEDERVFAILLEVLEDSPAFGATNLSSYGDPAAIDGLHDVFESIEVDPQMGAMGNFDVIDVANAIEELGGELRESEEAKVAAVERMRMREGRGLFGGDTPGAERTDIAYEMNEDEIEEAKRKLAQRRRRLRGKARRDMKKAAKFGRYRVHQCLISHSWRDERMANIIQVRKRPDGNYVVAGILVDLGCLGPKSAFLDVGVPPERFEDLLSERQHEFEDCSPHLAAKISQKGALLAAHLGFSIPDEAFAVMAIMERFDPEKSDEEVSLGANGKPLFVPGPNDDVRAILAHLDEHVGPEGYEFTSSLGGSYSMGGRI